MIRQIEMPEPPRPPPPPRTRDVLECDGCGVQVEGARDGACWTLPEGWFRGHVTDGSSGAVRRDGIELCPGCRKGAVIVPAPDSQWAAAGRPPVNVP